MQSIVQYLKGKIGWDTAAIQDPSMESSEKGRNTEKSANVQCCDLCQQPHWTRLCTTYKTPGTRIDRAMELKLCLKCYRNSHQTWECQAMERYSQAKKSQNASSYNETSKKGTAENEEENTSRFQDTRMKAKFQNRSTEGSERASCCALCHLAHWTGCCTEYITADDRISAAKRMRLCFICLQTNHEAAGCNSKTPCFYCKGPHNSALCCRAATKRPISGERMHTFGSLSSRAQTCNDFESKLEASRAGVERTSNTKAEEKINCCAFCQQAHRSHHCIAYKTAQNRSKKAKELGLCFRCLQSNHRFFECEVSACCYYCGGTHNSALCFQATTNRGNREADQQACRVTALGASNNPVQIKWRYNEFFYRFEVAYQEGYAALMEKIRAKVPEFDGGLAWKDEEGDMVTLNSEEDFAFAASMRGGQEVVRLFTVKERKKDGNTPKNKLTVGGRSNSEQQGGTPGAGLKHAVNVGSVEKEEENCAESHNLPVEATNQNRNKEVSKEASCCAFCHLPHGADMCTTYTTADDRMNFAKQNRLCFICLKTNHQASGCKVEKWCSYCTRSHNSALCFKASRKCTINDERVQAFRPPLNQKPLHPRPSRVPTCGSVEPTPEASNPGVEGSSITNTADGTTSCAFCRQAHWNQKCSSYQTVEDRFKRAKELGLCFRCLWSNHRFFECKVSACCYYCGGTHNSALCFQAARNRENRGTERRICSAATSDIEPAVQEEYGEFLQKKTKKKVFELNGSHAQKEEPKKDDTTASHYPPAYDRNKEKGQAGTPDDNAVQPINDAHPPRNRQIAENYMGGFKAPN